MAGMLSNLFDGSDEGGESGSSNSYEAAAGGEPIDASPSIVIEQHGEGEYQGVDGSTHGWSSDNEVALNLDVAATLGAAAAYEDNQAESS